MMCSDVMLWKNGEMSLANALMTLVMSFLVFNQIKALGMGVSSFYAQTYGSVY